MSVVEEMEKLCGEPCTDMTGGPDQIYYLPEERELTGCRVYALSSLRGGCIVEAEGAFFDGWYDFENFELCCYQKHPTLQSACTALMRK